MKVSLSATSLDELKNWPTGVPHLYASVHTPPDRDVIEVRVLAVVFSDPGDDGLRGHITSVLEFSENGTPAWRTLNPFDAIAPTVTIEHALQTAINGVADDLGRALAAEVLAGIRALS